MTPAPATFRLGAGGERTVFPVVASTNPVIVFNRQTSTVGQLTTVPVPTPALFVQPGMVGQIAFGKFLSPDWETPGKVIPPIGTRTGVPRVQATREIYFNLVLPRGTPPPDGWPVAIFGHGFGDNKNNSPMLVAATMASHGIPSPRIRFP